MSANLFAPRGAGDIRRLVLDHPLAWVVCPDGLAPSATLLPIRPVFGPDGEVRELIGHLARRNPLVGALARHQRALFLFLGPQGYVSPSWLSDRAQAPTWNYASVQFVGDVGFVEDPGGLEDLLRDLIVAMETGRPQPWSLEELGARYAELSPRIIGFRAPVAETRATFKLGQDERSDVFAEILQGLEDTGQDALACWMRTFADLPDAARR